MLKIYTYVKCSSCRDATAWLRDNGVPFQERPIRVTPPTVPELEAMLAAYGGELRRLFNTSGRDYRELNLAAKLPSLSESEALALLSKSGNLVKRPFLLGEGVAKVGFNAADWAEAL